MPQHVRFAAAATFAIACIGAPLFAQSAPSKPKAKVSADSMLKAKDEHAKMHTDENKSEHDKMHQDKTDKMDKMDNMEKEHAKSAWKELDAYHKLMMDTWHPAKSSNDLKPLKLKAKDLSASAKSLAKSTPPAACNRAEMVEAARQLAAASDALAQQVLAGASDATLKSALQELHEKFERLEAGCR